MRNKYHNRMETAAKNRASQPPVVEDITLVPQDPPTMVVRCGHCGSARGMEHISGGKGESYKQCTSCGAVWAFSRDRQTMRRVR